MKKTKKPVGPFKLLNSPKMSKTQLSCCKQFSNSRQKNVSKVKITCYAFKSSFPRHFVRLDHTDAIDLLKITKKRNMEPLVGDQITEADKKRVDM